MPFLNEHKQKFDDLRAALHEDNRTQLKRSANGGNTVLFIYPPAEEEEYIAKAKELYPDGHFIDVVELFVKSIDSVGIEDFKQFYKDNGEIHQHAYKFIPDSLRFFDAIIKCEEMGTKIDDFVLNEANDGRKFYHMTYIRNKMEKLK